MALMKGKWIRIECDNEVPKGHHPENTIDVADRHEPYSGLINIAKIQGWKKIKGKWYCPDCTVVQKFST